MKMFKTNPDGTAIGIPQNISTIINELGVVAPNNLRMRIEYLESIGYVGCEPSAPPPIPPALNGKCRIKLALPTKQADGTYKREFEFEEIDQVTLDRMAVANRKKRDTALANTVDRMNIIRWNSLTPVKQQEWSDYRQAMLDITETPGWPANPVWPALPAN